MGGIQSSNLNFQAGDCRNGRRTVVTDEQVDYFIDKTDNNIFPIESELYSVPHGPGRHGRDDGGGPRGQARLFSGDGDDIVVLIDNVRDDNFYDIDLFPRFSYIAGFFSSS